MDRPADYRHLELDSYVMGIKVGEITPIYSDSHQLNRTITEMYSLGYKLIFVKSMEEVKFSGSLYEHQKLSENIFFELVLDGRDGSPQLINSKVEPFNSQVSRNKLNDMAYGCSEYSHLRKDKKIKKEHVREIYGKWVENALSGKSQILLYMDEVNAGGMAVYSCFGNIIHINLLYVEERQRNRGVATSLINRVIAEGLNRKADRLRVAAQRENSEAVEFYERKGFVECTSYGIYHLWKR